MGMKADLTENDEEKWKTMHMGKTFSKYHLFSELTMIIEEQDLGLKIISSIKIELSSSKKSKSN